MYQNGLVEAVPLVFLIASMFATIKTVFDGKSKFFVASMGAFQVICLLWYISTFIPGGFAGPAGLAGLGVILRYSGSLVLAFISGCCAFIKNLFGF